MINVNRIEELLRAVPRVDAVKQDGSVDSGRDPDYAAMAREIEYETLVSDTSETKAIETELQEENARLKQQISELEAKLAAVPVPSAPGDVEAPASVPTSVPDAPPAA